VTFCVISLVGPSGCDRVDNGSEEQLESDSTVLEHADSVARPAVHIAGLVPGAKLDRQQVAALATSTPSTIGQFCALQNGVPCQDPINSIVRECGGFTNVCDSTGTEDILPILVLCFSNVCTAVASQNQQTIGCTVPTDGRACSTGCGADFCAPYANECVEETDRVRNCFSNGVCSNDTCANQTFSQEVVGTCTRETEGNRCTPLTPCQSPKVGICNVVHNCACLLGPQ
jgi:hypothetical protein